MCLWSYRFFIWALLGNRRYRVKQLYKQNTVWRAKKCSSGGLKLPNSADTIRCLPNADPSILATKDKHSQKTNLLERHSQKFTSFQLKRPKNQRHPWPWSKTPQKKTNLFGEVSGSCLGFWNFQKNRCVWKWLNMSVVGSTRLVILFLIDRESESMFDESCLVKMGWDHQQQ